MTGDDRGSVARIEELAVPPTSKESDVSRAAAADDVRRSADASRPAGRRPRQRRDARARSGTFRYLQRIQWQRELDAEYELRSAVAAAIAASGWPDVSAQRR